MKRSAEQPLWTSVGAALVSLLLVAGCNAGAASPSPSEGDGDPAAYTVIATTSVFADLAQLALGDSATIETIIPAGVTSTHSSHPPPTHSGSQKQTSSS